MKLFDEILAHIDEMKSETFIREILIQYNLHNIFNPIYAIDREVHRFGDICTAFIILAYSNGCKWLDYRKDRRTTKVEVMDSIIIAMEVDLDDKLKLRISQIIDCEIEVVEKIVYEFVEWQKDGNFIDYISLSTHISLCRRQSSDSFGVTAKILNERDKFLEGMPQRKIELAELISTIEKKFQNLDEVLKQEGKTPISERTNNMTWEDEVAMMRKNNSRP